MKLLYSTSSPFVRKISVVVQELALQGRIEHLPSAANPLQRDPRITEHNPLGKVPVLLTDDGLALFDSRVIAEYLCSLVPGNAVLPADGVARWTALRDQALADGLLDAALLVRYEVGPRPQTFRWTGWTDAQTTKVTAALEALDRNAAAMAGRCDIGVIATGCALGYLDLRFPELAWRLHYPALAEVLEPVFDRPAFVQTVPLLVSPGAQAQYAAPPAPSINSPRNPS